MKYFSHHLRPPPPLRRTWPPRPTICDPRVLVDLMGELMQRHVATIGRVCATGYHSCAGPTLPPCSSNPLQAQESESRSGSASHQTAMVAGPSSQCWSAQPLDSMPLLAYSEAPGKILAPMKTFGARLALIALCLLVTGCGKSKALEEAERARDEAVKRAEVAEQAASAAAAQIQVLQQAAERSKDDDARRDTETALRAKASDDDAALVTTLQQKVTVGLKDPASAQFRNVALNQARSALCGEVNAKDGVGGYVGFRPFVVSDSGAAVLNTACDSSNLEPQLDCLRTNLAYAQAAQSAGCVPAP